jgi:hypothetical protein
MKIGDRVYRAGFSAHREVVIEEATIRSMGRRIRLSERIEGRIDVAFDDVASSPEEALLALHARESVNLLACASALGDAKTAHGQGRSGAAGPAEAGGRGMTGSGPEARSTQGQSASVSTAQGSTTVEFFVLDLDRTPSCADGALALRAPLRAEYARLAKGLARARGTNLHRARGGSVASPSCRGSGHGRNVGHGPSPRSKITARALWDDRAVQVVATGERADGAGMNLREASRTRSSFRRGGDARIRSR